MLRADFHADSAVTVKLLEGLRRGLTAAITYHVQVWQKRWLSDLVAERRREQRAAADVLGVKAVHFLDFIDGELVDGITERAALSAVIREAKPELYFKPHI